MPRKKREPKTKISQKQKSVQAVKQTVKVVVGETKPRKRRAYRRKPAAPAAPAIQPIPQIIQLPAQQQQSPFAMFSPEQFATAISRQFNQRREEQPALAQATAIPQEGQIPMSEPEQEPPSLAQVAMSPEAARAELEAVDERLRSKIESFESAAKSQEKAMEKIPRRERARSLSPASTVMTELPMGTAPRRAPQQPRGEGEILAIAEPSRIPRAPARNKADYIREYIGLTGPSEENRAETMTVVQLKAAISELKRQAGVRTKGKRQASPTETKSLY
jgi:hypothetical protein